MIKDINFCHRLLVLPRRLSIFHWQKIAKQTWLLVMQTMTWLSAVFLLVASTPLSEPSCQVNVRMCKGNSWAPWHINKQLSNQCSAAEWKIDSEVIEMVFVLQFSCSTRQKLGNSRCQTWWMDEWMTHYLSQRIWLDDLFLQLTKRQSS